MPEIGFGLSRRVFLIVEVDKVCLVELLLVIVVLHEQLIGESQSLKLGALKHKYLEK
jgi:hypothetical protein